MPREDPSKSNLPPGPTIRGPWVVVATLSLFLVVPALVWAVFEMVDQTSTAETDPSPLIWAERNTWPRNQFTVFKSLERGQMSSARTNKVHQEKLSPEIPADQYLATQRCSVLAELPRERFLDDSTRLQLQAEIEAQPELFYANYLLGTWYRLHGHSEKADAALTAAFARAPAALMRHHVDARGEPAVHTEVPTLALVVDRIVDDRRDPTLELVYPFLETDDQGFVYVPVYKAILRHRTAPLLPGLADTQEKPQWFSFFGRVGRLPDETLR